MIQVKAKNELELYSAESVFIIRLRRHILSKKKHVDVLNVNVVKERQRTQTPQTGVHPAVQHNGVIAELDDMTRASDLSPPAQLDELELPLMSGYVQYLACTGYRGGHGDGCSGRKMEEIQIPKSLYLTLEAQYLSSANAVFFQPQYYAGSMPRWRSSQSTCYRRVCQERGDKGLPLRTPPGCTYAYQCGDQVSVALHKAH